MVVWLMLALFVALAPLYTSAMLALRPLCGLAAFSRTMVVFACEDRLNHFIYRVRPRAAGPVILQAGCVDIARGGRFISLGPRCPREK